MTKATTLYFFPLSCARIAMVALEQTGIDYEVKLINLMEHAQKSPEYLAVNPDGRVPAIKVGEKVLIENTAIIFYLNEKYPAAALLPARPDPMEMAMVRSDLIWCATTLHPLVRQTRATQHYTTGDLAPVKAKGLEFLTRHLAAFDLRFSRQNWWFGDDWSMVDGYLAWIIGGFTSIGGDLSVYPGLVSYTERLAAHPAYSRMYAREGKILDASGIQLPPGVVR